MKDILLKSSGALLIGFLALIFTGCKDQRNANDEYRETYHPLADRNNVQMKRTTITTPYILTTVWTDHNRTISREITIREPFLITGQGATLLHQKTDRQETNRLEPQTYKL